MVQLTDGNVLTADVSDASFMSASGSSTSLRQLEAGDRAALRRLQGRQFVATLVLKLSSKNGTMKTAPEPLGSGAVLRPHAGRRNRAGSSGGTTQEQQSARGGQKGRGEAPVEGAPPCCSTTARPG